jgi:hypothetical protein
MKITTYVTATAKEFAALDKKVAELFTQGFQPYGSPYASRDTSRGLWGVVTLAQAMVKSDQDK